MTRAEEYRRKAEDADREADKVKDLGIKQAYREIAKQWRDLARSGTTL